MNLQGCTYRPDIELNISQGGKRSGVMSNVMKHTELEIEILKTKWIHEALTKILGREPILNDYLDIKIHQYTSHDYLMITYKNVHIAKMQTKFNQQTCTIDFTITPLPIESIIDNLKDSNEL